MKKIIILLMLSSQCLVAYAESTPRLVAADKRVKMVMYDPNNVVLLHARYGYQTQIAFAPNEMVQSVSIGDSLAWQVVPVNHYLFIKPVASSNTNMTVLTNLNSYNFQLNSINQKVSPTYKLQFIYPHTGFNQSAITNSVATFNPENLNWKYSFTGFRALAPIAAFDNGQFTYFKFKTNGMSHLPSVFIVDDHRNESLVNYHMQGDYMVVNTVAKQFTLRDGAYVTSIYNDNAIYNLQHCG